MPPKVFRFWLRCFLCVCGVCGSFSPVVLHFSPPHGAKTCTLTGKPKHRERGKKPKQTFCLRILHNLQPQASCNGLQPHCNELVLTQTCCTACRQRERCDPGTRPRPESLFFPPVEFINLHLGRLSAELGLKRKAT